MNYSDFIDRAEIYQQGQAVEVRKLSEQASPTLPTELSGETVWLGFVLAVDRFPENGQ